MIVFIVGNVALLLGCISVWVFAVSYTPLARYPWMLILAFPTYFFISIYFYSKLK